MGRMARLYCENAVSNRGSAVTRVAAILNWGFSRVGGRVHGNLVARVEDGGEASENLGHRSREHHVPGSQEQGYITMSVMFPGGNSLDRLTEV